MIVAVLSIIALLIRIMIAAHGGLWRDEALFVAVARLPSWGAMLDFLQRHESHPPLFYAVARIWLSVTGDTDAAAVAIPVLLGTLIVPVIYWVGKSLFSQRVGLVAATLATFSPALSEHSALVRPYSLLPLLVLLSSYALIRAIDLGNRRYWAGYGVITLTLLYTHNWAWVVLFAQWIAVAIVFAFGTRRPRATIAREWLVVQLIVGIGYLPWAPWLLYQSRNAGHAPFAVDALSDVVTFAKLATRAFFQATILAYPLRNDVIGSRVEAAFQLLPLVLLAIALSIRLRRIHMEIARAASAEPAGAVDFEALTALTILLVTPVAAWLIAIAISPVSNMVLIRCLVMLAPLLLVAFAYSLEMLRTAVSLPLPTATLVALVGTYAMTLNSLTHTTRSNARDLAAVLAARTQPSDLLIVAPEWLASSFNRYYMTPIEQIDFPYFGRETTVDFAGMRNRTIDPQAFVRIQQKIAQARRDGRRAWLVMEENNVGAVPSADITRELQSPSYAVVVRIRASQIRAELTSRYGPPDTILATEMRRAKFEHLRADLFTPRD